MLCYADDKKMNLSINIDLPDYKISNDSRDYAQVSKMVNIGYLS